MRIIWLKSLGSVRMKMARKTSTSCVSIAVLVSEPHASLMSRASSSGGSGLQNTYELKYHEGKVEGERDAYQEYKRRETESCAGLGELTAH